MKKPLILLLAVVAVLAAAVYGAFLLVQAPSEGRGNVHRYGEAGSSIIFEYLLKYDENQDNKISLEEFKVGYRDIKIQKSEREDLEPDDAFARLDANHDGNLDKNDVVIHDARRAAQQADKRREDMAAKGLYVKTFGNVELFLNPLQRDWLDAEIGAANRDELLYGGVRFERKWFGEWEEEKRANAPSSYRLKKPCYAHVMFYDGKSVDGFARESGDEESAKKLGLAPNKVYILGDDARISVYGRDKVKSVDYMLDDAHVRYIKEVSAASPAEVDRQLALARQCIKDGLKADALMLYRRVLIFQYDNQEALDALGYKLNERQYVKVK